ncbi:hypothetical protein BGZ83_010680, partial [Gryganskiella cystojenkinii]
MKLRDPGPVGAAVVEILFESIVRAGGVPAAAAVNDDDAGFGRGDESFQVRFFGSTVTLSVAVLVEFSRERCFDDDFGLFGLASKVALDSLLFSTRALAFGNDDDDGEDTGVWAELVPDEDKVLAPGTCALAPGVSEGGAFGEDVNGGGEGEVDLDLPLNR